MNKFQEIINSSTPVLVDFYADWCAPCKQMTPVFKQVKDEYKERLRIIKINVDQHQDLAARYNIRSIPTMLMFKNGQQIWSGMGAMPAQQLSASIQQYL